MAQAERRPDLGQWLREAKAPSMPASKPAVRTESTARGETMSDIALRQNILSELEFEPSLDAVNIGVAVKDGIVTLTGHVAKLRREGNRRAGRGADQKRARDRSGDRGAACQQQEDGRRPDCQTGPEDHRLGYHHPQRQDPAEGGERLGHPERRRRMEFSQEGR
jgi:hypothetical protein